MTDLQQRSSIKMRELTEIKQESSNSEENEGDFVQSVTPVNHFSSQTATIKQEESSNLGEDGVHLNKITSLTCQVKTEPQNEEGSCELESTAEGYPSSYVVKREIIEVHTEDHPMMDDEGNNNSNTTKDGDSETEANHITESENDNFTPSFPDNHINEQKNMSDLTTTTNNELTRKVIKVSTMNRGGKTTIQQFECMLNFMDTHDSLFRGLLTPSYTNRERRNEWEELALLLNSIGNGPQKTAEKWRKTWKDWKSYVKAKASRMKQGIKVTGGGPMQTETLSPLEERLVVKIGPVCIEGYSDILESSVTSVDEIETSSSQLNLLQTEEMNEQLLSSINEQDPCTQEEPEEVPVIEQNELNTNEIPNSRKRKREATNVVSAAELAGGFSDAQQQQAEALQNISTSLGELVSLKRREVEALERKTVASEKKAEALCQIATAISVYLERL